MPAPLEPGALLDGRYRLGERLGVGGMASVYRAEDEQLGRTVAIKLFASGVLADSRRQEREARALATLSDPGLVTLFDAELEGEHPHLVMEYIDGEDLAVRLRGGPLPARDVVRMLRSVGGGLAHAHARGLVHRDVKPANILIPRRGGAARARLADFGIARLVDGARLTTLGSVVGTAAYLSPEQVTGADVGPASDVYSFGLVLLEALTGDRAFEGSSVEAALARVSAQPAIPAGVPDGWRDLIGGMTAPRPEERLSIAEALEARSGLETLVAPPGSNVPTVRMGGSDVPTVRMGGSGVPTVRMHGSGAPEPTGRIEPTETLERTARLDAPDAATRVLRRTTASTRPFTRARLVAENARRRGPAPLFVLLVILMLAVVGSTALVSGLTRSTPRTETSRTPAPAAATVPAASPAVASAAPSALDQALTALDAAIGGREAFATARASLAQAIASGDSDGAGAALTTIEATAAEALRARQIDTATSSGIATAVARVRSALGLPAPPSGGKGGGNGKVDEPPGGGKPGKPKP